MWLPAAEEDVFGLFDDFLQQPLAMLQVGDLRLVVGQRTSEAKPFVSKGGASRMWHHHRAQLLLVKLHQRNKIKVLGLETQRERQRQRERWRDVLLLSSFDANCVPVHKGSHLVLVSLVILVGASFQLWSGKARWRAADLHVSLKKKVFKLNPGALIKKKKNYQLKQINPALTSGIKHAVDD